jgi:hypothetical protein
MRPSADAFRRRVFLAPFGLAGPYVRLGGVVATATHAGGCPWAGALAARAVDASKQGLRPAWLRPRRQLSPLPI